MKRKLWLSLLFAAVAGIDDDHCRCCTDVPALAVLEVLEVLLGQEEHRQEGHQDDEVEGKLDGGHLGNGQEVQLEREFLGKHILILEKEKGYITAISEYGKGSCFSVFLQNCKN